MGEEFQGEDQTRLCPTCRMPISILAVRCRHCGDSVGRPRKEQAELTVEDLGGERHSTYTVSGNVMDALEAFRAEEISQSEIRELELRAKQGGTWLGRGKKKAELERLEEMKRRSAAELPDLDPLSQQIERSTSTTMRSTQLYRTRSAGPTLTRRLLTFSAITAALVLLGFATTVAYGKIRQYFEPEGPPPRISRAMNMIQAGSPTIDALKEANEAYRETSSEGNAKELAMVRTLFMREIDAMLNTSDYNRATLDSASDLVSKAFDIDRDVTVAALRESVSQELADYNLVLESIEEGEGSAKKARLRVQAANGSSDVVTFEYPGDEPTLICGRFRVTGMTSQTILMKDEKRSNRPLKIHISKGLMRQ